MSCSHHTHVFIHAALFFSPRCVRSVFCSRYTRVLITLIAFLSVPFCLFVCLFVASRLDLSSSAYIEKNMKQLMLSLDELTQEMMQLNNFQRQMQRRRNDQVCVPRHCHRDSELIFVLWRLASLLKSCLHRLLFSCKWTFWFMICVLFFMFVCFSFYFHLCYFPCPSISLFPHTDFFAAHRVIFQEIVIKKRQGEKLAAGEMYV